MIVRLRCTLALDLEHTLIRSFDRPDPRPGLREFLDWARARFDRLVIYTGVAEPDFRRLARLLAARVAVPGWFPELEHFAPVLVGQHLPGGRWDKKILRAVEAELERILLVEDDPTYVWPSEAGRVVMVESWEGDPGDMALASAREGLESISSP